MSVSRLSKIKSSAISNRSYIDTSVEPGERGSNYIEFVAFSAAPKKRNRNREIPRRCIGTLVLRRIHVLVGATSDSRAEFLTTARILSLAGQLVVGISRERNDFSFLPVAVMHFDSPLYPSGSLRASSPHFLLVFLRVSFSSYFTSLVLLQSFL